MIMIIRQLTGKKSADFNYTCGLTIFIAHTFVFMLVGNISRAETTRMLVFSTFEKLCFGKIFATS